MRFSAGGTIPAVSVKHPAYNENLFARWTGESGIVALPVFVMTEACRIERFLLAWSRLDRRIEIGRSLFQVEHSGLGGVFVEEVFVAHRENTLPSDVHRSKRPVRTKLEIGAQIPHGFWR
jgi:hypothetical protein